MGRNIQDTITFEPALTKAGCHRMLMDMDRIPLPARIFAVIDTWDSLSHERPYKVPWPDRDALAYIKLQFDPQVVDVFLKAVEETK